MAPDSLILVFLYGQNGPNNWYLIVWIHLKDKEIHKGRHNNQECSTSKYLTILNINPHPNDLPLFEGQLLISCIWVGGHGQRIVVKEGHKDPEGLLGLRLIIVRGRAAIPVPVAILNTLTTRKITSSCITRLSNQWM